MSQCDFTFVLCELADDHNGSFFFFSFYWLHPSQRSVLFIHHLAMMQRGAVCLLCFLFLQFIALTIYCWKFELLMQFSKRKASYCTKNILCSVSNCRCAGDRLLAADLIASTFRLALKVLIGLKCSSEGDNKAKWARFDPFCISSLINRLTWQSNIKNTRENGVWLLIGWHHVSGWKASLA